MDPVELDFMEYANDGAAQAAYVTDGLGGAHSVSAWTASLQDDGAASNAGDSNGSTYWGVSTTPSSTVPWIDADLGFSKIVSSFKLWSKADGANGVRVKDVTLQFSDNGADYTQEGTYQHTNVDGEETFNLANPLTHQFWRIIVTSQWSTGGSYVRIHELTFIGSTVLQSYSEATLKVQGSYALKGIAAITDSLNKTLTRTASPVVNLTDKTIIKLDMRASRTGSNIKIGIHDSGGTTTEITPNILMADTYQTVVWDLSGISNANKDAIDSIIVTIVNADAANTFYLDNLFGHIIENFLIARGRDRMRFRGYSLGPGA
jgi:hypothetical protein